MPNVRWLLALITACHRALYRVTRGRVGGSVGRIRVLLLESVGRKSGRCRVTPLLYVEDGDRFVVVASNAGDDRDPGWWLNLKSRPMAEVQVRGERIPVHARRASAGEAAALWPRLDAAYRYYPDYRRRTSREIPVVVLERAG